MREAVNWLYIRVQNARKMWVCSCQVKGVALIYVVDRDDRF